MSDVTAGRLIRCLVLVLLASTVSPATRALGQTHEEWDVTRARGETRVIDFTTDEGTWMSVDVSPDGRWILFDLLGHIYRVPSGGGEAENLTGESGVALNFHPRYSPDGRTIAFVSDRRGQQNLWVMDADGTRPRPVFLDPVSRISEPAWAPDGWSIVAVRHFPTYSMHRRSARLWRFPLAGGAAEELVGAPSGTQAYWPTISPDGRYVYYHFATFAEPLHGLQRLQHIRRLDVSTGVSTAITRAEPHRFYWSDGAIAVAPEISPDGRWLAFARRIPGAAISFRDHVYNRRTALWLRDLESGEERVLMDPITLDMSEAHGMKNLRVLPGYAWARDGRSLVLSQGGKLRRVWVEDGRVETIPFTARVRRVASEMARSRSRLSDEPLTARFAQWPASSPDGSYLVFGAVGWIWRMDLPNGSPRRLISADDHGFEFMPVVSPDGRWIAFVSWDDTERGHVWKVPATGGPVQRLTREAGEYLNPTWAPDGESLVAIRGANSTARGATIEENLSYDLMRIPASGGAAELLREGIPLSPLSFGPGERIFFTLGRGAGDIQTALSRGVPLRAPLTILASVDTRGQDYREHTSFPTVLGFLPSGRGVVSPDGARVAIQEGLQIYIAPVRPTESTYVGPLHWSGVSGPAHVELDSPGVVRLSREGGLFPRWRNASTLEFVSGNRYYAYDTATGRMDTVDVSVRLPRRVPAGRVALTGARIITLDDRGVIENGTVLVAGSRITCVGECELGGVDEIRDVTGTTIVPGFVDAHAHHFGGTSGVVAQHRYLSALYLAYGVTTVLDPSGEATSVFPVAELIEAGRLVGPRTFSTGNVLMPQSPDTGIRDYEDAQQVVNRLASWGAISLKNFLQPRRDQSQTLAEAARRAGLSLTAEGADLYYNLGLMLDGHTGWEHPLHYIPLYSDASRFFGAVGAAYSPTLVVAGAGYWASEYFQPRADLWRDAKQRRFIPWHRLVRALSSSERPLEEYSFPIAAEGVADIQRAGGRGVLGGHGEHPGLDTHWEIWMYSTALDPMETLELASLGGAYMLGLEADIGSITEGKVADLLVLKSNPLEDIRSTTDIAYVMKGGILYDANTLDELWPESTPYLTPWFNAEIFRADVLPEQHWDLSPGVAAPAGRDRPPHGNR